MKSIILFILSTVMLTGCFKTFEQPKVVVNSSEIPYYITENSVIVSKDQLIGLNGGKSYTYKNDNIGNYYIPNDYIEIYEKDGKKYFKLKGIK